MISLAAALVLSLQPGPISPDDLAPPTDARSVELSRVFPFWEDYQDLAEDRRDAFSLAYRFSTVTEPADGGSWRFWTDTGNGPEPLRLGPLGAVTPPEDADFTPLDQLLTDAPEGGVAVAM